MDYKVHIAKAIDFIEDNLKQDIDIYSCADVSGYSEYHFLRIFKEVTKLTPADYIRKRRLTEIVKQMNQGSQYISEVAFEYGFNSKENFTRAFKAEHNILPTEYRLAQNSLKLYEKIEFDAKPFYVTPTIMSLNSFQLTVYKCDEDSPPSFWNKYNSRKFSKRLSNGIVCEDFGVSSWNSLERKLDYYIGIRSEQAKGNLSETQSLYIKGGLYAVFETPRASHFDFVNAIHNTWHYISAVWLPQSGYKRTGEYEFESYIEESRIFSEKIYIPIKEEENEKA